MLSVSVCPAFEVSSSLLESKMIYQSHQQLGLKIETAQEIKNQDNSYNWKHKLSVLYPQSE